MCSRSAAYFLSASKTVPAGPEDVTPSWLRAVLDRKVDSARWERVGEDRGFTGLVGKVTLTYDDLAADQPASLIVKLPMAEGESVSSYRATQQRDRALARRYYE